MMGTRRIHGCIDVRGLLLKKDRDLRGWLTNDDGRELSPQEARLALMDELLKGHEVIPVGDPCEGFNFKTGCPGHPADG